MEKWDEKYAGYVVWSKAERMFVGPDGEHWRVALRSAAVRFTKTGALAFVEEQEKPDDYVIEDAT